MINLEETIKRLKSRKSRTVTVDRLKLLRVLTALLRAQHEVMRFELEDLFTRREEKK